MTTEEKAKRYDEALRKAKDVYTYYCDDREQLRKIESIFPELKESEDERIRGVLIAYFDDAIKADENPLQSYGVQTNKAIAWLEKQGEKKIDIDSSNLRTWKYIVDAVLTEKEGIGQYLDNPFTKEVAKKLQERFGNIKQKTDNVVRSFKVGDWIIGANNVVRIISLNDELNCYIAVTQDNEEIKIPYYFDNGQGHTCAYHLWTIADAKDGDALVLNDEVFIYDHRKLLYSIAVAHCFVDSAGGFYLEGEFVYTEKGNSIHPATREQRNLLFQKIKEAGYEWDAKNKTIIKLL